MARIGIVISDLAGGGGERVVLNLADAMARLGHDVHVIIFRNLINLEVKPQYHFHCLTQTGKISGVKLLDPYLMAAKLKGLIKQIESDGKPFNLIISNLMHTDTVVALAKLPNCIYLLHILYSFEFKQLTSKPFKAWRRKRRFINTYKNKNLVAVSQAVKDDFLQVFGNIAPEIQIVYNPFSIQTIHEQSNMPLTQLPKNDYIVYIGRSDPAKRIDILLNAFKKVKSNVKLVLLGRINISNPLDDRIIVAGFQKNVYPWIKHAKLLVLSSESEALCNAIIEALICGTPVVATACPGAKELLTGNLARWLVTVNDANALAEKIDEALSTTISIDDFDPTLFDQENIAKHYLSMLKS